MYIICKIFCPYRSPLRCRSAIPCHIFSSSAIRPGTPEIAICSSLCTCCAYSTSEVQRLQLSSGLLIDATSCVVLH